MIIEILNSIESLDYNRLHQSLTDNPAETQETLPQNMQVIINFILNKSHYLMSILNIKNNNQDVMSKIASLNKIFLFIIQLNFKYVDNSIRRKYDIQCVADIFHYTIVSQNLGFLLVFMSSYYEYHIKTGTKIDIKYESSIIQILDEAIFNIENIKNIEQVVNKFIINSITRGKYNMDEIFFQLLLLSYFTDNKDMSSIQNSFLSKKTYFLSLVFKFLNIKYIKGEIKTHANDLSESDLNNYFDDRFIKYIANQLYIIINMNINDDKKVINFLIDSRFANLNFTMQFFHLVKENKELVLDLHRVLMWL